MKKVLIELLKVSIVCLICCLITTMIIDKRVDSIDKRIDSIEKNEVNSNEMYEKLVIEELAEIYGNGVYIYSIEELECNGKNEDVKYICFVRFYDVENYVERIMYVKESGLVFTEVVLEEIDYA